MPLTATISLNVQPLPVNDTWFANAAAWSNYWANQQGQVAINAIATTIYIPQPADNTLPIYDLKTADGIDHSVPSLEMFQSLFNQVAAIDTSLQLLRTALKNAGLITNAQ